MGGAVTTYVYVGTYITFLVLTAFSSFSFFLCYICYISRNLSLQEKDVFVRNDYFSSMRLISFVMKQAFFT